MIPGRISRIVEGGLVASASSVFPLDGEMFRVTGTTTINNIAPPLGIMQSQVIYLLPTDGAVTLGTSGNILVGIAMAQNRMVSLFWVKSLQKWIIENGV